MKMKIFGTRMSMIGDIIMSLPVLQKLHEIINEPYTILSIAQKCKQIIPLLEGHPLINEIKISDLYEGLGEYDFEIMKNCNIILPVRPEQPEPFWYNKYNLVEQTTIMAGFKPSFTHGIYPKLYINKDLSEYKKNNNTICIWPFAGYGSTVKYPGTERSPSLLWWQMCVDILIKNNFHVLHCGVNIEPSLSFDDKYIKITDMSFADQIYHSLGCNLIIGTDSGSMWVTSAYGITPQINLITNWSPNHYNNKLALAPVGNKVKNIYKDNTCSNVNIENELIPIIYEIL